MKAAILALAITVTAAGLSMQGCASSRIDREPGDFAYRQCTKKYEGGDKLRKCLKEFWTPTGK